MLMLRLNKGVNIMRKYLNPEIILEKINEDVLLASYDNTEFIFENDNIADDIF